MSTTDSKNQVVSQIIAALDQGTIPWRKPWSGPPPQSISGHVYRNTNVLVLMSAPYSDPRWLTFNRAKAMGAMVKKGEKSTRILRPLPIKDKADPTKIAFNMYSVECVFNVEQLDKYEDCTIVPYSEAFPPKHDGQKKEEIEDFLQNIPFHLVLETTSDRAFVRQSKPNTVHIPEMGRFDAVDEYYATLFHELVHLSGFESRLNRDMGGNFGNELYSFEELVAEFGSAILCSMFGVDNSTLTKNHVAYIQNWSSVLKSDLTIVSKAADMAQKAVDYLTEAFNANKIEVPSEEELVPA